MRECKICHCEIRENIRKHEESQEHINFLEKAINDEYIEKDINVHRLKDILYKRIIEHDKIFTNFTILFCWKVDNIEYSISLIKEEIPDSGLKQESLDGIMKRVFNQININNFEEFTLMFVSDIRKINTQILYKPSNANDTKNNLETVF